MSQIPRSQFVLKKRHNQSPVVTIPVLDIKTISKVKKSQSNGSSNGSGNGHKNGNYDNDVVIIEDDSFPDAQEEVVPPVEESTQMEHSSPSKKKRSRKSKDSTESRDSETLKKVEEAAKSQSPDKAPKSSQKTLQEEPVMQVEEVPEVEETSNPSDVKELKIVKLTSEGLTGSKRRSDRLQNASTIVNLSTISSSDSTKTVVDETFETSVTERHLGKISGRRSTRPTSDIIFAYRSQANDSLNTTTNATIGSDYNNESLLGTPDRKRRASQDCENKDSASPKRNRLSGFFNSFSSPVAILRDRFKGAKIASTPIVGGAFVNETVESLDTSGDDQLQEINLNEEEEISEYKVKVIPIQPKKTCTIM